MTADLISIKDEVHMELLQNLGPSLYQEDLEVTNLQDQVYEVITNVLQIRDIVLSAYDRARLVQEVVDEILGLGPIQSLLRNDQITEIMVNRFDSIYVEQEGKIFESQLRFSNEEHLRRTIERIVAHVGRRIDESSPLVDARLPDGSRVNAVVPPIALDGAILTIRKFSTEPFTIDDLIALGTITEEAATFLRICVEAKLNVLISGGTGSGKTTTLNVLSSFIPDNERVITVEDAAELQLAQPHVVRMESRPVNIEGKGLITIRDLVRNSLRMRPDRIVVGEVRDGAALDMLQAMNTGHEGSLTTIHANSSKDALVRIENLVLMAGVDFPIRVIREQISEAIDIIIHQARLRDGSRRITEISEVTGIDVDSIQLQDIFRFASDSDEGEIGVLRRSGLPIVKRNKFAMQNVEIPKGF
jgi:pilus assembly protein CpaF